MDKDFDIKRLKYCSNETVVKLLETLRETGVNGR
jgi:hypothetical protein